MAPSVYAPPRVIWVLGGDVGGCHGVGPAEHAKPELQKEVLRVAGTELYQLVRFITPREEVEWPTICDSLRSLSLGLHRAGTGTKATVFNLRKQSKMRSFGIRV